MHASVQAPRMRCKCIMIYLALTHTRTSAAVSEASHFASSGATSVSGFPTSTWMVDPGVTPAGTGNCIAWPVVGCVLIGVGEQKQEETLMLSKG